MIERKAFFEVLPKSSKTSVTEYLDNNQEASTMEIVIGCHILEKTDESNQ